MKKIPFILLFLAFWCNAQDTMVEKMEPFYVVGIAITTTNENGKSATDMGELWGKFYSENVSNTIPDKVSDAVYVVYTEYESDYTGQYLAIIGHKVKSFENLSEALIGIEVSGGNYQKRIARGGLPQAVVDAWKEIWDNDAQLHRAYDTDFEVYGEKANQGENSEAVIYLSVK